MDKSEHIHIAPRKAPRLPRDFYNAEKLDSERMLATLVRGIILVGIIGGIILLVRHLHGG